MQQTKKVLGAIVSGQTLVNFWLELRQRRAEILGIPLEIGPLLQTGELYRKPDKSRSRLGRFFEEFRLTTKNRGELFPSQPVEKAVVGLMCVTGRYDLGV